MLWSEFKDRYSSKTVYVDGNAVWDYKVNEEGKLSLISEPVENIDKVGKVAAIEITEYLDIDTQDCEMVSESDNSIITEDRIVCS